MRKLLAVITVAGLALGGLGLSSAGAAANSKSNPLGCFDGASEGYGNGVCTQRGQTFTLNNPTAGDYSGVFVDNFALAGTSADSLSLRFAYSGATSGGSPRFSVPLDVDGDGGYDGWLYVDTACDANEDGLVDLAESGCIVADSFGYYGNYADYNSGYLVGDYYTFIVADQPGVVTVKNIKIGRTTPGKL